MNPKASKFLFALCDLLLLNLIHFILVLARVGAPSQDPLPKNYFTILFIANMAWLVSAYFNGLYLNNGILKYEKFAKLTTQTFVLFLTLMLLYLFLIQFDHGRQFISLNFIAFGVLLFVTRFVIIIRNDYFPKKGRNSRNIIILGYNELSKQLVEYFATNTKAFTIKGYFEDYNNINELSAFPILGMRNECVAYAIENGVKEIYSTISPETHSYVYELAHTAEKNMIRFKFVPDFRMFINRNFHVEIINSIPILSLRSEPLEDPAEGLKKRLFDVVFSFLVITLILSWLVPIMAILIKLTSKGPVFFVQLRSGKDNNSFHCFKFRTLRINGDADSKQVTRDDNRITWLGKFLRKSSLDELPQFFNVLIGDMSVVGPRPHMLKHTEDYSRIMNEYMIRHFVKPGVTGWAQVCGYRGEIKKEEELRSRIEHDIHYLENWSLWLDFKIIFLTLYVTFRGDKNAF